MSANAEDQHSDETFSLDPTRPRGDRIKHAPAEGPEVALLMADLGYGDSGKGLLSDYLCRARGIDTIVRYCGGPNAGHNVSTCDGRHATFVQLGAGSFLPDVRTLISRFMLINPIMLDFEARAAHDQGVENVWARLFIDRDAQIIAPYHIALNRFREMMRGVSRLGSTGQGVSEAIRQRNDGGPILVAGDIDSPRTLRQHVQATFEWTRAQLAAIDADFASVPVSQDEISHRFDAERGQELVEFLETFGTHDYRRFGAENLASLFGGRRLLFEGSQGVLLDPVYGFVPYTTSTRTTFTNAQTLIDEAGFNGQQERVGILRTYATRHGPGPFVSESDSVAARVMEAHNQQNPDQGRFRVGDLDVVSLKYAIEALSGVDWLTLTHCDTYPPSEASVCTGYVPTAGAMLDLPRHFEIDDGIAKRIRCAGPPDRSTQVELTDALLHLDPVVTSYAGDFIESLEVDLNTPIRLLSYGPTAADVRTRAPSGPK